MKDFKPAPKTIHKHKNLTQDDLQEVLDKVFQREDNHNKSLPVDFDEDYNLDPEETIKKLKEAGYKIEKHYKYPDKKRIYVTL